MDQSEIFKTTDVTIVLNVWKRSYLEEQIKALMAQSVLPKEIWVIQYENYSSGDDILKKFKAAFPHIFTIKSSRNLKYFGRFSIAMHITTKFTWIIDDDVIPGRLWLQRSIEKCEMLNSIITCTGRIIPVNSYTPEKWTLKGYKNIYFGDFRTGKDKNFLQDDLTVDYACSSYFYQTDWIKAFWSIRPLTLLSGEDIHLCASCKTALNVPTTVLQQLSFDDAGNTRLQFGWDRNASWKKRNFVKIRKEVFKYHIKKNNWTPILWEENN